MLLTSVFVSTCLLAVTKAFDNGLARTPQMGWNSWNHFACDGLNQEVVKQTAQQIVDLGFDKLGYVYVNLDDCWQSSRDPNTDVIQADPKTFPDGIPALVDFVHGLGLKFGLYSDAGTKTCAGRPGSLGYEVIDAQTYAEWGVDYLKYDNCNNEDINVKYRYEVMFQALNYTGHPILYSMCEWGVEDPATWAPAIANSWRTTSDVRDNFDSVKYIVEEEADLYSYAGPGAWNDADMLEVGNGGMTTDQYWYQFTFWSLLKSPLLIGCDMNNMSQDTIDILTNKDVIAVNQDPLGKQGVRLANHNTWQLWGVPMADGSSVILLWNDSDSTVTYTFTFEDLKKDFGNFDYPCDLSSTANVRDLINQKDLGTATDSIEIKITGNKVAMYQLTPTNNNQQLKFLQE